MEIAGGERRAERSLAIRGNRVLIRFSLPGKTIGMQSRAAIRTDTILGRKNLEIEPRGSGPLKTTVSAQDLAQTTTPYQIYDLRSSMPRKAATGWDIDAVKRSLNVSSETFDQTAPAHLSAALEGVRHSPAPSAGAASRSSNCWRTPTGPRACSATAKQVNGLLVNAKTLLAAFKKQRSQALLTFC